MPQIKSAKKRMRQDAKRRLMNRSRKGVLRSQLRKVTDAIQAGDREIADKEFRIATKLLDRAGLRRLVHANLASRKKSALAKKINAIGS
ncbi:MAG: 30S ribosomal protein S20 [Planctomycetes bacterium]|nr:30S ribosomal protein S20 [Planctomycetota bacterium]